MVLLGPPQVGKTTLARKLEKEFSKPGVYFDLENPEDAFIFKNNPFSFLESRKDDLIILDEIQRVTFFSFKIQYRQPSGTGEVYFARICRTFFGQRDF